MNSDVKNNLLKLARETIESYLKTGIKPETSLSGEIYDKQRAVFVTLTVEDQLRGCIGQLEPRSILKKAVIDMAVSAAVHDTRFSPVTIDELSNIDIEISVLTPMTKINDYRDVRLGIDGVVIQKGYRGGVFLPQVATETNWDLDTFLKVLCQQKAGLNSTAYKEPDTDIYVFQVEKFSEKDLNL